MWVRSLHVYVLIGETRKCGSGHCTSMTMVSLSGTDLLVGTHLCPN